MLVDHFICELGGKASFTDPEDKNHPLPWCHTCFLIGFSALNLSCCIGLLFIKGNADEIFKISGLCNMLNVFLILNEKDETWNT